MGGGGCDGNEAIGFALGLGAIEIFTVSETRGSEIGSIEP